MLQFKEETMREGFTKYHLELTGKDGYIFRPVFHNIDKPDTIGPHDHPWNFTVHVLKGGYIERRYIFNNYGEWSCIDVLRKEGSSFHVLATTIHEIISLPYGETWTAVIAGWPPKEWRFWQFNEQGVFSRLPDDKEFTKYK